jgi:anti-sigma regulatory factor (Ser/Thr protein kinase)
MHEPMLRRFENDLSEIVAAREFLRETVLDHARLDDLLVIVSELATNAVQHAAVPFEVSIENDADRTRVQVADGGKGWPHPAPTPSAGEAGGRGLRIVAALAARWGVHDRAPQPGKTVWAEVPNKLAGTR